MKNKHSGGIDLEKRGCHNCANCIYVGEGDYLCNDGKPETVITEFSAPTEYFFACEGWRWKKQ